DSKLSNPVVDEFTSDPAKPKAGEFVTLRWSASKAESLTLLPWGITVESMGARTFTACGGSDIVLEATLGTERAQNAILGETVKEAESMQDGDSRLVENLLLFKVGLFNPYSGMAASFDSRTGRIDLIDANAWRREPKRREFVLELSKSGFRIRPNASDFR